MRLVYFDFPGRGEAIRDALRMGGVAFEDVRLSYPEFRARREAGDLPWDTLPVLEFEDGRKLGQSNALLRWAGSAAGLTPADPFDALRVDALLDNIEDYGTRLSVSIRVTDEAVRDTLRAELAARWLPEWFALLTRRLNEAGAGWLVGGLWQGRGGRSRQWRRDTLWPHVALSCEGRRCDPPGPGDWRHGLHRAVHRHPPAF
jgi:glutathione S-transferase